MYAMQYRIDLPADYDMEIVRTRVRERGTRTDGFPGLALKAYCVADRARPGRGNAYAPFYLWERTAGTAEFLFGDPFAGLAASFGRPTVAQWLVLATAGGPGAGAAPRSAVQEREAVPRDVDLRDLRAREHDAARGVAADPAVHTHAVAIDPTTWQLVRFTLRTDDEDATPLPGVDRYEVLHLSTGGAT